MTSERYLYYGNLFSNEPQFRISKFIGLAINPQHEREIRHNALHKLPFSDGTISKIQSQDVFEHLPYGLLIGVLNDIYRVLRADGVFRLSVPDYRSDLLKRRSIYNQAGEVIGDIMMGAMPIYDSMAGTVAVNFGRDGNSHLWFPKYESVLHLIVGSDLRLCKSIRFYQYYRSDSDYVCDPFPENEMHVSRAHPFDERSKGRPISIIVDFVK
jgi:hypothetical protein